MSLLKSLRKCISSNNTANFATQEPRAFEWSQFEILARILGTQSSLKADITCIYLTVDCPPATSALHQRHARTLPTDKGDEAQKEERGGTFYSIKI